jgi:hypothetical protein
LQFAVSAANAQQRERPTHAFDDFGVNLVTSACSPIDSQQSAVCAIHRKIRATLSHYRCTSMSDEGRSMGEAE